MFLGVEIELKAHTNKQLFDKELVIGCSQRRDLQLQATSTRLAF
jgi:hypothetical protein